MQWKSLSDSERAIYENIAAQDRARYEEECRVRIYMYLFVSDTLTY